MLEKIDWVDFVVLVCTETYDRRFRDHEIPGKDKGVNFDGVIINNVAIRFVAVLIDGDDEKFFPEQVRGRTSYPLASEPRLRSLTNILLGQTGAEPRPIGPS